LGERIGYLLPGVGKLAHHKQWRYLLAPDSMKETTVHHNCCCVIVNVVTYQLAEPHSVFRKYFTRNIGCKTLQNTQLLIPDDGDMVFRIAWCTVAVEPKSVGSIALIVHRS